MSLRNYIVDESIIYLLNKKWELVPSGKLYANVRWKVRTITADILESDDMQCAKETFDSKGLRFL